MFVCVCVRACMHAYVRACMCDQILNLYIGLQLVPYIFKRCIKTVIANYMGKLLGEMWH